MSKPPLLVPLPRPADRIPSAYVTRRVPRSDMRQLLRGDVRPEAGDLVLARVDEIGHHSRIQLPTTARKFLFLGDEIILAYGNRYAPAQFEAVVPRSLEPCHLVAAGGIAAMALSWHERIRRGPTEITPIGLIADADGRRVNLSRYGLPPKKLDHVIGRKLKREARANTPVRAEDLE